MLYWLTAAPWWVSVPIVSVLCATAAYGTLRAYSERRNVRRR